MESKVREIIKYRDDGGNVNQILLALHNAGIKDMFVSVINSKSGMELIRINQTLQGQNLDITFRPGSMITIMKNGIVRHISKRMLDILFDY